MVMRLRADRPDAPIDDASFFGAATFANSRMLDEAKRGRYRRLAATPGGALAIAEGRIIQALLDNNPFRRQEDRDHFADGMRKAGIAGDNDPATTIIGMRLARGHTSLLRPLRDILCSRRPACGGWMAVRTIADCEPLSFPMVAHCYLRSEQQTARVFTDLCEATFGVRL
jgi:hypothetical protein